MLKVTEAGRLAELIYEVINRETDSASARGMHVRRRSSGDIYVVLSGRLLDLEPDDQDERIVRVVFPSSAREYHYILDGNPATVAIGDNVVVYSPVEKEVVRVQVVGFGYNPTYRRGSAVKKAIPV